MEAKCEQQKHLSAAATHTLCLAANALSVFAECTQEVMRYLKGSRWLYNRALRAHADTPMDCSLIWDSRGWIKHLLLPSFIPFKDSICIAAVIKQVRSGQKARQRRAVG